MQAFMVFCCIRLRSRKAVSSRNRSVKDRHLMGVKDKHLLKQKRAFFNPGGSCHLRSNPRLISESISRLELPDA